MKRISTLIAMMLLLFVGGAQAQRGWEYDPTTLTEIIPGDDQFYVIQQGFGPANTKPRDGFLNSSNTDYLFQVDHSCIFNFIEVGTKEANGETFKIFILKNIANGKYICDKPEKYTASPIEAFKFTARKAQSKDLQANPELKEDWYEYSNAINGDKCPGAEGENWVFCAPDAFKFLMFKEHPGFSTGYVVATNWRVYTAKEKALSSQEKFNMTFDQYFGNTYVDVETFPVGENPGCISQSLFDELKAVYDEALAATENVQTDEKYEELNQKILDVFAKYEANVIKMTDGYYSFYGKGKQGSVGYGFLADEGFPKCDANMAEYPSAWTTENAKYIWKIESVPGSENKFYIKNIVSQMYMNKASSSMDYIMGPAAKTEYTFNNHDGYWFYIKEGNNIVHIKPKDGKLNNYGNNIDNTECHWAFYSVSEADVEALRDDIIQANLNKELAKRVKVITVNLKGLENKCGLTMDGNYAYNGTGMINSFENANAHDSHVGSAPANAFDRNVETLYQTEWSDKAPAGVRHWVQLNFNEPVSDLIVKFTRRIQDNSVPTRIGMFAAEGDVLETEDWTEQLYEDTVIYTYPTEFTDTIADSTTYIKTIKLSRPAQHVRLTATSTDNNKYWNEGGPTWCLAEMRFYKAENNVHNPSYDLIPTDTIARLNAAIERANAELAANAATQETLDELEAANESVHNNYPNATGLRNALEAAYYRLSVAVESANDTDWGYFHEGAKATFQANLEKIAAVLKDENTVLGIADIENLKNQLNEAINGFNTYLIVPANGIYHIVCAPGEKEDGSGFYPEEGGHIASVNADCNTPAVWGYVDDNDISSKWNTLWKIEKNEEGKFSFRNLANGLYLDNPYEGLTYAQQDTIKTTTPVTFSHTPKYITLEAAAEVGKFMLTLKNDRYINASGQGKVGNVGKPVAIWNDYKNGARSRYTFEPVADFDFSEGNYSVNCEANSTQIMSFPIDIKGVLNSTFTTCAYKVLGVKENMVQLKPYTEGDVIPAGTPFIVFTTEDEDHIVLTPVAETYDAFCNNEDYNYESVNQNGLVSCQQETTLEAGYGLIFQDKVIASAGGEVLFGGTGYFDKVITPTDETGERQLILQDFNTGVEEIITTIGANHDVYTITGVKVRQQINGNANLQGLPKGIYIVGGKKVLVK